MEMIMDENENERILEYHRELDDIIETDRMETNNCVMENQKAQDQSIFVIAAALFGLMPFLLDKFQNVPHSECLIFFVLLCNVAALISTLLSFGFCRKGAKEDFELRKQYIHRLKELSRTNPAEASRFYRNNKPEQSCYTSLGMLCNVVSLASMIIVSVVIFFILVLYPSNKEINMASQNNNGSQQSSSVVNGNEGFIDKIERDIPQPPQTQTSQQPQTKSNNESSKTSKEDKNDKKQ